MLSAEKAGDLEPGIKAAAQPNSDLGSE